MSLLNKIEQFLADYDRRNPPEKQARKEELKQEIDDVLADLSCEADPVFKEFSSNPLSYKSKEELNQDVQDLSNKVLDNYKLERQVNLLIGHLSNYMLYKSICDLENAIRNESVKLEDTPSYEFLLFDLANDVFEIQSQIEVSTKDLISTCYFLAFKDYIVSVAIPMFQHVADNKPKKHIFTRPDPMLNVFEREKEFLLDNDIISQLYKNFILDYKQSLRQSKCKRVGS